MTETPSPKNDKAEDGIFDNLSAVPVQKQAPDSITAQNELPPELRAFVENLPELAKFLHDYPEYIEKISNLIKIYTRIKDGTSILKQGFQENFLENKTSPDVWMSDFILERGEYSDTVLKKVAGEKIQVAEQKIQVAEQKIQVAEQKN